MHRHCLYGCLLQIFSYFFLFSFFNFNEKRFINKSRGKKWQFSSNIIDVDLLKSSNQRVIDVAIGNAIASFSMHLMFVLRLLFIFMVLVEICHSYFSNEINIFFFSFNSVFTTTNMTSVLQTNFMTEINNCMDLFEHLWQTNITVTDHMYGHDRIYNVVICKIWALLAVANKIEKKKTLHGCKNSIWLSWRINMMNGKKSEHPLQWIEILFVFAYHAHCL